MDEQLYHRFLAVERTHWWFRARRELIRRVTERLCPTGSTILDLGCGTGYFLECLSPEYEAWGLDFSPLAVRMCQDRGLARVRVGSTEDLSAIAGRRFELVSLLDVIEHLDDDLGALRRVREVLKPGGYVVITVPAFRWMWSHHDEVNHHRRRYSREELGGVMKRAGLKVTHLTYFNCHLFPLAWAIRTWRKARKNDAGDEFAPIPVWLNGLLERVFLLERHKLLNGGRYPFGLSLLGVGQLAGL